MNEGSLRDIFIIDVVSAEIRRVTDEHDNVEPAWSPDGSSLMISSTRTSTRQGPLNLWLFTLDGSRPPEQVTNSRSSTAGTDWYRFATCGDSGR